MESHHPYFFSANYGKSTAIFGRWKLLVCFSEGIYLIHLDQRETRSSWRDLHGTSSIRSSGVPGCAKMESPVRDWMDQRWIYMLDQCKKLNIRKNHLQQIPILGLGLARKVMKNRLILYSPYKHPPKPSSDQWLKKVIVRLLPCRWKRIDSIWMWRLDATRSKLKVGLQWSSETLRG